MSDRGDFRGLRSRRQAATLSAVRGEGTLSRGGCVLLARRPDSSNLARDGDQDVGLTTDDVGDGHSVLATSLLESRYDAEPIFDRLVPVQLHFTLDGVERYANADDGAQPRLGQSVRNCPEMALSRRLERPVVATQLNGWPSLPETENCVAEFNRSSTTSCLPSSLRGCCSKNARECLWWQTAS